MFLDKFAERGEILPQAALINRFVKRGDNVI
ncbi:MAG: hypothetical protein ACI94Y_000240 [Maribacter sp.]|jgi:hypothetical protein